MASSPSGTRFSAGIGRRRSRWYWSGRRIWLLDIRSCRAHSTPEPTTISSAYPSFGFDHGGFSAWWAAWIEENDGQHGISPMCVLWNSDRWWWLWFPSSPFTTTSCHQGSLLDLSLYLFFSWTDPLGASFFDPWWCRGFGLFNGSKYVWVMVDVVEIWL